MESKNANVEEIERKRYCRRRIVAMAKRPERTHAPDLCKYIDQFDWTSVMIS